MSLRRFVKFYAVIYVLMAFLHQLCSGNSKLKDMTYSCQEELHTASFLTFGMGLSDAVVIIISTGDFRPDCSVTFHVVEGLFIILTVEIPDRDYANNTSCVDGVNMAKIITVNKTLDICRIFSSNTSLGESIYCAVQIGPSVTFQVQTSVEMGSIKITATSGKGISPLAECNQKTELKCIIKGQTVCISRELMCDGNYNCGTIDYYDEDSRDCDAGRYDRLWLVVVIVTVMLTIISMFLFHLLRNCVHRVPDNFFLYNEGEDNMLSMRTTYTAVPKGEKKSLSTVTMACKSGFKNFQRISDAVQELETINEREIDSQTLASSGSLLTPDPEALFSGRRPRFNSLSDEEEISAGRPNLNYYYSNSDSSLVDAKKRRLMDAKSSVAIAHKRLKRYK